MKVLRVSSSVARVLLEIVICVLSPLLLLGALPFIMHLSSNISREEEIQ